MRRRVIGRKAGKTTGAVVATTLTAVLATALGGCTAQPPVAAVPTHPGSFGGFSFNALARARVAVVDGCFMRGLVFPEEEVSWNGETFTVGGRSWELGETAEFGGGHIDDSEAVDEINAGLPEQCRVDDYFFVQSVA